MRTKTDELVAALQRDLGITPDTWRRHRPMFYGVPAQLPGGAWGIRVDGEPPLDGDLVLVTAHDGRKWHTLIKKVIDGNPRDGYTLCTTHKKKNVDQLELFGTPDDSGAPPTSK